MRHPAKIPLKNSDEDTSPAPAYCSLVLPKTHTVTYTLQPLVTAGCHLSGCHRIEEAAVEGDAIATAGATMSQTVTSVSLVSFRSDLKMRTELLSFLFISFATRKTAFRCVH